MNAWCAAGQVALIVFGGFTALLFLGCLGAYLFNAVRDAVKLVEQARTDSAPTPDGRHDDLDMDDRWRREVDRWLNTQMGPPVSPGRN